MIDPGGRVGAGFGLAGAVALLAWRAGALSGGGAVAATVVGATALAGGGWWAAGLLVFFFASSSLLSRLPVGAAVEEVAVRGSRRDAVQVVANGGVAALCAALLPIAPDVLRPALFAGYAGSLAAATADTWATEIGRRLGGAPRLVTTGVRVEPGTSGGVTGLGLLASAAGAAAIGIGAAIGGTLGWAPAAGGAFLPIALAGFAGSLADSALGATAQAAYHCPRCDRPTERPVHRCDSPAILARGHPAVTNDAVNLAATAIGAAVAMMGTILNV